MAAAGSNSSSLATQRLKQERKRWRRDHPFGFYARPAANPDGSSNLLLWECGIPGKAGTAWEGGLFRLELAFTHEYPSQPPACTFPGGLFHPNVYPSGRVCLSIVNEEEDWRASVTIKQILLGIQDLLDNPNPNSPAQSPALEALQRDPAEYRRRVAEEVEKHRMPEA